ncbi:uncharacterized protein LOC125947194 [Dermacentor silvarum]|uniref:uncharacterized protein LOC125947194 n=1 Tax=Dermacentor silvarum TaxID=543639 RepID=UPI00210152D5|nr:uncharacterized protein LOC125947194 [Dermacentor silvarum]
MRMAGLSFIGTVLLSSSAAFPTTRLPSRNWPQHCAYGVFDYDVVVEPVVENAVNKAKDNFEIPLAGAAGDYEYGPFTMSALQLQPMKRRLCRCSDGDENSFYALYNTSVTVSVPWKLATPASDTTKAVNGTFRADYKNSVVMVRFRLIEGADKKLCATSVKVLFSEMNDVYVEDVTFAFEPVASSTHDREEYAQLAAETYNSVHVWLERHLHGLGEKICFSLA